MLAACLLLLLGVLPVQAALVQKTLLFDHDGLRTTHYTVSRSTDNGGTFVPYGQTLVGTRSFTDAAVPTGTTLCYEVTATGEGGTSAPSTRLCFQVPEPPEVPLNLRRAP